MYSPGWPRTYYIGQAGFELVAVNLPLSAGITVVHHQAQFKRLCIGWRDGSEAKSARSYPKVLIWTPISGSCELRQLQPWGTQHLPSSEHTVLTCTDTYVCVCVSICICITFCFLTSLYWPSPPCPSQHSCYSYYWCLYSETLQSVCESQRTTCGNHFSPSVVWVPGIYLRSSDFAAKCFSQELCCFWLFSLKLDVPSVKNQISQLFE